MNVGTEQLIIYEQPLNDPLRICLRLEHLFTTIRYNIDLESTQASRNTMAALLEVLNVIDRPDLKSKLTQTLTQYALTLAQLEQFAKVDGHRLKSILQQLDESIHYLQSHTGRIGEELRINSFLMHIRVHLGHPGGATDFSTPTYALWLRQDTASRQEQLKAWFRVFGKLRKLVDLVLRLTRQSATTQKLIARSGFHQQALDANLPCSLLRLKLPLEQQAYPEISVGKHRLCVRFLTPNYDNNGRPFQLRDNIPFEITYCRV